MPPTARAAVYRRRRRIAWAVTAVAAFLAWRAVHGVLSRVIGTDLYGRAPAAWFFFWGMIELAALTAVLVWVWRYAAQARPLPLPRALAADDAAGTGAPTDPEHVAAPHLSINGTPDLPTRW